MMRVWTLTLMQSLEDWTPSKDPNPNAGTGGMDPRVVADAILRGVKAAVSSRTLQHLTTVYLVLVKINVFQQFQAAAQTIMGVLATPTS